MAPLLGARWDGSAQRSRLRAARDEGLIDFVEANYPLGPEEEPDIEGVPVFVHCAANSLASPAGLNRAIVDQVAAAGRRFDSPWIGEHLGATGPDADSRLGYLVNPILSSQMIGVAVENARAIAQYYGRPLALELGPQYQAVGDLPSELHFLGEVARQADCHVIFDVAHYMASNVNLGRPADYGLGELDDERIVELHLAGLRPSRNGDFLHDAHELLPDDAMVELAASLARRCPALRAITFEHDASAKEEDFMGFLGKLRRVFS